MRSYVRSYQQRSDRCARGVRPTYRRIRARACAGMDEMDPARLLRRQRQHLWMMLVSFHSSVLIFKRASLLPHHVSGT